MWLLDLWPTRKIDGVLAVDKLPNLDKVEEEVAEVITRKHSSVLETIENLLNMHLSGFSEIGDFTLTANNKREQAWLLLTNRAFNSFRWGYHVLGRGYYSQCFLLTRSALEDWLVCQDCGAHDDTVEALLAGSNRVADFRTMAGRLDEQLKTWWFGAEGSKGIYGLLSTFCHPRHRAVVAMVDPDSHNLRLGPAYDEPLFITASYYLLEVAVRMTEFVGRLVHPICPSWTMATAPHLQDGNQCLDGLLEKAKGPQNQELS